MYFCISAVVGGDVFSFQRRPTPGLVSVMKALAGLSLRALLLPTPPR